MMDQGATIATAETIPKEVSGDFKLILWINRRPNLEGFDDFINSGFQLSQITRSIQPVADFATVFLLLSARNRLQIPLCHRLPFLDREADLRNQISMIVTADGRWH